jgi:hypothetical protein
LGVALNINFRRRGLWAPALIFAACLAGCASWTTYGDGFLKGRVVVQWSSEDKFIYLKTSNPLSFQPSFMSTPIVPETMYTDGGSIPRIFWNIPGLSPWGLGPAYVIHDWLFEVHRCHRPAPPEVAAITFEQSAQILAEVGKSLIEAGLVQNNKLEDIVWAIRTKYARDIWDSTPAPEECAIPVVSAKARAQHGLAPARTVVDFAIPAQRRSLAQ